VRPDNPALVSLPGYMEILSGRRTKCMSNRCRRVGFETVLDAVARDSAASGAGRAASISSWATLARAATSGAGPVLVSAGRQAWPKRPEADAVLEESIRASLADEDPFPGTGLYRRDEDTARIALAYLRAERPRLLHVGLGDTDEYGHRNDFDAYAVALRMADIFVADVAEALDETDARATVIVTTDHGRAATFRDHGGGLAGSERSFVIAFGDGHEARGVVCEHRDVRLPDIGATVRALAGLPADDDPHAGEPVEELLPRAL
jgi:hypothetical protein